MSRLKFPSVPLLLWLLLCDFKYILVSHLYVYCIYYSGTLHIKSRNRMAKLKNEVLEKGLVYLF